MSDRFLARDDRLQQAIRRRLASARSGEMSLAGSAVGERPIAGDGIVLRLGGIDHGLAACFVHTAAGGIAVYQQLADRLGTQLRLYGLAPPQGPAEAEAEVGSLEALAASRANALMNLARDGEIVLIGWSLAGVLAHAVARHLERRGVTVRLVALLDSQIPSDAFDLSDATGDEAAMAALDEALRSQAVATLQGEALVRARRRLVQSVRLTTGHIPAPIRAPVLCVRALRGGISDPSVEMWRGTAPFGFDVRCLDCGHGDLLAGDHAAEAADTVLRSIQSHVNSTFLLRQGDRQ